MAAVRRTANLATGIRLGDPADGRPGPSARAACAACAGRSDRAIAALQPMASRCDARILPMKPRSEAAP